MATLDLQQAKLCTIQNCFAHKKHKRTNFLCFLLLFAIVDAMKMIGFSKFIDRPTIYKTQKIVIFFILDYPPDKS